MKKKIYIYIITILHKKDISYALCHIVVSFHNMTQSIQILRDKISIFCKPIGTIKSKLFFFFLIFLSNI
jgi:hypothetical protein